MLGVAVARLRGPQPVAVVVDRHRPVDDLVLAVTVHVTDGQTVRALAVVALAAVGRRVGVEGPAAGEGAAPPVPGRDHRAGVVAAGHDERRAGAVQVRRPREEAVHPVAVRVAPRRHRAPRRDVVDALHRLAGLSVEHGQVLGAGQDIAAGVAVVGGRAADHRAGAVHRAVRRLHGDLGLAVAVVVVRLELRVVRAGTDVAAQVDPPQPGAVELDAVQDRVAGVAGLGVVLGVGRLPLEDEVQRPVAVEVGHGRVVGLVGVGDAVRGRTAGRRADGHVLVAAAELDRVDGVGLLDAAHDRADRVVGLGGRAGVEPVRGAGDRGRVDLGAGAVDVEGDVVRVGAEPAPADQVAAAGVHADDAPVELLDLAGGGGLGRTG